MSKNKDKSADGGTPEKAEQVETPKKATAVEIVVRPRAEHRHSHTAAWRCYRHGAVA